ncbi:MAG: hypothetical protein KDA52_23905 [Planctomycetaceae bacterium]|nr:hypothetical protein [Planctomycetaceae bacterium]
MIDSLLLEILTTAFLYGLGGALLAGILRLLSRNETGPSLSQSLAIGFLAGGSIGAIVGMFGSLLESKSEI